MSEMPSGVRLLAGVEFPISIDLLLFSLVGEDGVLLATL